MRCGPGGGDDGFYRPRPKASAPAAPMKKATEVGRAAKPKERASNPWGRPLMMTPSAASKSCRLKVCPPFSAWARSGRKKNIPARTISQDEHKLFASSIAARTPAVKTVDVQVVQRTTNKAPGRPSAQMQYTAGRALPGCSGLQGTKTGKAAPGRHRLGMFFANNKGGTKCGTHKKAGGQEKGKHEEEKG